MTSGFWPECINKCGNVSTHRSGICKECRRNTCSKCKKHYIARAENQKICESCSGKKKRRAQPDYLGTDLSTLYK